MEAEEHVDGHFLGVGGLDAELHPTVVQHLEALVAVAIRLAEVGVKGDGAIQRLLAHGYTLLAFAVVILTEKKPADNTKRKIRKE